MYFLQALDMTAQMTRLSGRVWEQNLAVGQVIWTAALRQNMALLGLGRPVGVARATSGAATQKRPAASKTRMPTKPHCTTDWSHARPRLVATGPKTGPSPLEA